MKNLQSPNEKFEQELLLVVNDQPVATIADTPENMMWLYTWFSMSYLGENKYKRYKIETR